MFLRTIKINTKPLILGAAVAAIVAALPAYATTVDYTTTGMFTCVGCAITGNGTGAVTVTYGSGANTATLMFSGAAAGTHVNSPGTYVTAGYGTITASYTGTGSNINGTFTLGVNQTGPAIPPLSGAFPTATLSGLVYDGSSTSYANFGIVNPTITLGGPVNYELDTSKNINNSTQDGITIVSPSTSGGVTSLQGNINAPAVPEPTFLTLTGAGFIGLAAIALRRRKLTA